MTLFGPPDASDFPKRWKDMSLEFRLMFIYHACMMILFLLGGALSVRQELVSAAVLFLVFASLSIRHRRSAGWRWSGVRPINLLMATGSVVLIAVFLYAATPQFPPWNPRFLPWYLAGVGLGTFNILQSLRLVRTSEAAFLADCREPASRYEQTTQIGAIDPLWHRITRAIYGVFFVVVWLGFVAFFYYSGAALRDGSPVPTSTQMEALTEHGNTVYITHAEKILRDRLEVFALAGIPFVIAAGFILHFLVGVKLYPNAPTLREYLARRSSGR